MARIRSIHPGLFTDEAYMGLSLAAKAALPGIWTECDDAGAFEWKPIVLKARLFPADNVDMSAILEELSAAGCLKVVEMEGKRYGLVRNFRRWQRPEKPKYRLPLPDEHRSYVGLSTTDPQPVADQSPTDPRKSPQREEGGGMMEEVIAPLSAREGISSADLEARLREAAGWKAEPGPKLAITGPIEALLGNGADLELDVLPVVRALGPKARNKTTWNYFVSAIAQARDDRLSASTVVTNPSARRPGNVARQARKSTVDTILDNLGSRDGEGDPPVRQN